MHKPAAEVLPQGDVEKTIAELWRKTLKIERVGVTDNFFDLGGHSLLVVQLHNQLKQALNVPLSLTDLYQYPTIRSLSEYLSSRSRRRRVAARREPRCAAARVARSRVAASCLGFSAHRRTKPRRADGRLASSAALVQRTRCSKA